MLLLLNMLNSSIYSLSTEESHMVSGRSQHVYGTAGATLIIFITGFISLLTVLGNVLVLLSIKVNRNLRTINNYFLFSLACADLIVGIFSMNLYTLYVVKGYWPLGPLMCDLWLVVDYVVSNASVMNLLVICFDRYFCVTRPLSYPARRTGGWAGAMIAVAWLLSLLLWAPAILLWQAGRNGHKVPEGQCYILLLANPAVTLATTIPAFYLPVIIMTVLYTLISLASQRRVCRVTLESPNLPKTTSSSGALTNINLDRVNDIKLGQKCSFKGDTSLIRQDKVCRLSSVETSRTYNSVEYSPDAVEDQELDAKVSQPKTSTDCAEVCRTILYSSSTVFKDHTYGQIQPTAFTDVSKLTRRKASRDRKVTKTILAILLAFIFTWTPYNVMVLTGTFCHRCVPEDLWIVGYFLCYVNSMINPVCYAFCNGTFKRTFKQLLMCQFKNLRVK